MVMAGERRDREGAHGQALVRGPRLDVLTILVIGSGLWLARWRKRTAAAAAAFARRAPVPS